LPCESISSSLKLPLFFLKVKLLLIFFHVPAPWLLEPPALIGLPKSLCGGVVGGVIGSPKGLGDCAELSSVRPADRSAGDMDIGSEELEDQGEITAVAELRAEGTNDNLDELDV